MFIPEWPSFEFDLRIAYSDQDFLWEGRWQPAIQAASILADVR